MTAHIVVPALDDRPATVSPRVLQLLRGELGFDGAVVSDALEMQGLAASVGVLEGAVQALAAGVDALCVGHDLHEDAVDALVRAISAAVRDGRLAEERLAEAAGRVAALRAERRTVDRDGAPDGAALAARALRLVGDVALDAAPLVVELVPPPTMAAGPVPFRLADALRARARETTVVTVAEGDAAPELDGRPVVLALRDAVRYPWQQALAAEVVRRRPDAVVVEAGVPGWLPPGATRAVETMGASRASLEAAAAALLTS
jgi:beta-N-acetylhexosaminidase